MPTLKCDLGKNWFNTFDITTVREIIEWVAENKPTSNVLIIIDDCIATLKSLEHNADLMNFFYNRRKLIEKGTISYWITSQKYIMLPAKLRSVLTSIYVYQV